MDLEGIDFIRTMANELYSIDPKTYEAEFIEAEGLIYREIEPLFIALGVKE